MGRQTTRWYRRLERRGKQPGEFPMVATVLSSKCVVGVVVEVITGATVSRTTGGRQVEVGDEQADNQVVSGVGGAGREAR